MADGLLTRPAPASGPRQPSGSRPVASRIAAPQPRQSTGIAVSAAALAATLLAAGNMGSLVEGSGWWLLAAALGIVALAAAAAVRAVPRIAWLAPFAALTVASAGLVLVFAADTLAFGLIPTGDTFVRLGALLDEASVHIQTQSIPASQNTGLDFLLVMGLLAAVVFVDALAVTVRAPLLAGVPLLALAAVPGRILTRSADLGPIALTIAAVLLLVWLDRRRDSPDRGAAAAAGVTVVAIIGGLIGQAVAPAFEESVASSSSLRPVFSTGADPLVRLGDHLRRGADVPVMSYRTDSDEPVYLRVVTIDDLSGEEWRTAPLEDAAEGERSLEAFPAPEGLSDDVARTVVSTTVTDLSPSRRWLPVPYPAVSIEGLGDASLWAWQPGTLAVGGRESAESTGEYTVTSLEVQPTADQLRASDGRERGAESESLTLPDDLPAVITETTDSVVAEATTDYDRALAIQSYLRSSQFRYDEDTPEEADGDGDSFDVISTFLTDQRGYCVHFASAMAVMARTLDIPARIAVGYQPGVRQVGRDGLFEVTSHDLHAWPELYFEGVGWTRFEPTPGRGDVPNYESNAPADTEPTEAAAPQPEPTASTPAREREDTETTAAADRGGLPAGVGGAAIALAVLGLLAVPALIRRARRRGRLGRAQTDPSGAWQELHDTMIDLGSVDAGLSPRALATEVARILDRAESEVAGLDLWRSAAERARFARDPGAPHGIERVAELRDVIRKVERGASPGARALAVVAPRSLLPTRRRSEPTPVD
ncbi:MAG: DUF3488 and transglutaminase-like domain-containing protein [Naasia sp.]